ncbi:SDR family oxidoreductase [Halomonas sp. QX-2]|uniref:SDR family oxidoreductase n=1 Tax=Vreelandella sedimenti TaxID=2729618 RepID=A0A7Z0NBH4_9GAMM|nr:SDR family oxidoreductase [Halomonas sedimenti]NYT74988.1 SDR family oxidoreductase [Halomonas sedimenti]
MTNEQQILLVTGGSRGIGCAICRMAAKQGYRLVFTYRNDTQAAERLVAEIEQAGGSALAVRSDVSKSDDITRLFETIDAQPGHFAALVNNAGITGQRGKFMETSMSTVHQVFDVNVFGLMECSRQAVQRLSTQRGGAGGSIVNLSSGAAQQGAAGAYVWYGASKAAVETFTLGLAREVAGEGVRVNALSPGVTDTEIHTAFGAAPDPQALAKTIPLGRMGTPEEIAAPILWLMSDAAAYVTGAVLRVSGGR